MPDLIIWYLISIAIIALLTFFSIRFKFKRQTAYYIMGAVSFLSEATKISGRMFEKHFSDGSFAGYYLSQTALPFHLCSILMMVYIYFALSKNEERKERMLQFVVPVGIIGGLLGIIFATSGTSFTSSSSYQCFIFHSVVTWFSLYFLITKQVTLDFKDLLRNAITLFIISVFVLWINSILETSVVAEDSAINFMFLAKPPMSGLPFLNLNHGWFVYIIHLMVCGIVLLTAVHLPVILIGKKEKNKEKQ